MGAFDFLHTDANLDGWHGPVTSTIDWCELNYTTSYLIAEFINTLTNVPVIIMGLYGAWATIAAGTPRQYALVFIGLTLIGVGSFGFHCSLKWSWQLMDELPMIYVVSYAAYLVIDTLPGFKPRFGIWGPLLLIMWDIFVTVSYVMLPNPVYHQIAFALIMTSSILRSAQLIFRLPESLRVKLGRTLGGGVAVFVLGFAIWNADNYFCVYLRSTRAWLTAHGLGPLGHFTEGHGYWHLMTGYGSYRIFTACTQLCLAVKTSPTEWTYDEKLWFPVVRRVKPIARNAKPVIESQSDTDSPVNEKRQPGEATP
ncbi:hypothetical protein CspHIS471_0701690 [Cutaneotrichosporon sp. HIS471]|nr:hypothetical protein CspHIS471_0701690 [Cutaneotrichosporon sp. HIS471]